MRLITRPNAQLGEPEWINIISTSDGITTSEGFGSYDWDTSSLPEGTDYKIRIKGYDGMEYGLYDESDGSFTIDHKETIKTLVSHADSSYTGWDGYCPGECHTIFYGGCTWSNMYTFPEKIRSNEVISGYIKICATQDDHYGVSVNNYKINLLLNDQIIGSNLSLANVPHGSPFGGEFNNFSEWTYRIPPEYLTYFSDGTTQKVSYTLTGVGGSDWIVFEWSELGIVIATDDIDGDGIASSIEDSVDIDGDGIPDTDVDGDGIINSEDSDSDGDEIDDAIEGIGDPDGDSIPNFADTDSDGDGIGDYDEGLGDSDGDGILDDGDGSGIIGDNQCIAGLTESCDDNCIDVPNPDQSDEDGDGIGDACDIDCGLVAYYPFNSNANDESWNGNDGTVYGATLTEDRFGEANSAYSFDGTNDYLETRAIELPIAFTISAWINPNDLSKWNLLISKDDEESVRSYFNGFDNNGKLVNSVRNTSGGYTQYRTNDVVLSSGFWQFIVMTYDGNAGSDQKMKFFVNASEVTATHISSYDSGGTPETGELTTKIGTWGNAAEDFFTGLIDEIRIYNRTLSEAEVNQLYAIPIP